MKQKRRFAASLAAAVAMAFVGVGTAQAAKQPGAANDGMTARAGIASADECDRDLDHDCPKPSPKPKGCFDIDSAVSDPDKYLGVVCNGQVYVLTVREAPPSAPQPVGDWQFVGGPANVVDATLAMRADELYVSVLTTTGLVYQGVCAATEPLTVPCTFTQMPTPP